AGAGRASRVGAAGSAEGKTFAGEAATDRGAANNFGGLRPVGRRAVACRAGGAGAGEERLRRGAESSRRTGEGDRIRQVDPDREGIVNAAAEAIRRGAGNNLPVARLSESGAERRP